jgi:ABC-type antimicrobial peptide transport system permease subunit
VCSDGKYNTLAETPQPAVFRPQFRDYDTVVTLVARTQGDSRSVIASLRKEFQAMDPTLPLYDIKTLTEHMKIPLFPARIAANVLGSFGVLALVLAAIGIYGVMSYVVAGRTREIGLRMALGAQLRHVRQLILGQGMILASIGLAIGLAIVFILARFLTSMLYGVSPTDPITFVTITFLLAGVALVACYIPARRAARVDPAIALRAE